MNPLLGVLKKQNRSFDDVYIKTSVLFKKAAYKAVLIRLPKGVGSTVLVIPGSPLFNLLKRMGLLMQALLRQLNHAAA